MKEFGLRFGPLGRSAVHLCVDMQRVFAEETGWHTPWMGRVLPIVTAIVKRNPKATIFTRFIPPVDASDYTGSWQRYFERWPEMTRRKIDLRLLELAGPLGSHAPPATVIDKPNFSGFHRTRLAETLRDRGCDCVIVSGAETDMCVLATVLDAIDLGLRVVLAQDALCSSSDAMHEALLSLYSSRFSSQLEIAETAEILSSWEA